MYKIFLHVFNIRINKVANNILQFFADTNRIYASKKQFRYRFFYPFLDTLGLNHRVMR